MDLAALLETEREERRADMVEIKQLIASVSAEVRIIDAKINQFVLDQAITKERMATKVEVEEAKAEIRKLKFLLAIVGSAVIASLAGPSNLLHLIQTLLH